MSENLAEVNTNVEPIVKKTQKVRNSAKKDLEDKGEEKEAAAVKMTQGQVYEALCAALNRDPLCVFQQKPDFQIGAYYIEGKRQPFKLQQDGSIRPVDLADLEPEIYAYSKSLAAYHVRYILTAEQTTSVSKAWLISTEPIPKPRYLAFKEEGGYALRRLDFDLKKGTWVDCPTFAEMFGRIKMNEKALMAAIWFMVIAEGSSQQYIWLMGKGGDGKGSLMRFLTRLFGEANVASQTTPPWEGLNKHWAAPLLNKRLLVIPELKSDTDLDNAVLKSLTGGDYVMVDRKNKDAFSARLDCHVIVGSNEKPNLGAGRADRRRIIYVPFEPRPADAVLMDQRTYDDLLWSEAAAFLSLCKEAYEEICPKGGAIPVDKESIELLDDELEERNEDIEAIIQTFCNEGKDLTIEYKRLIAILQGKNLYSGNMRFRLPSFLESKYELRRLGPRGNRHRVVVGLGEKLYF